MPTVRHKPAIARITRQLDAIIGQTDVDVEYITLGFLAACFEFKSANRLTWGWLHGFFQVAEFIAYRDTISKTSLYDYFGLTGMDYNKPLPESIALFFLKDSKGRYTLSPAGTSLRSNWNALLRRVLHDQKERYRLLYDHWDKDQVKQRRERKRFFSLEVQEQIRLARLFFMMPGHTPQERQAKQAARRYLYVNYDVRPLDLLTLANQYPIIQAVKHMPAQDLPADLDTLFRRPEQEQTPNNIQPGDNTLQDTAT